MITRRQFTSGCMGLAAAALATPRISRATSLKRLATLIDEAIGRGVRFLQARQAADGAWRSSVYGPLKDGPSLTALIAAILAKLGDEVRSRIALLRAVDYLINIDPSSAEITYPVYAAAGAVKAFESLIALGSLVALGSQGAGRCAAARDEWLAYLRSQQLVESLGWKEADESFGGWSFAHEPPAPIDGKPASPMAAPNLSATIFALDALRFAGCPANDPAVRKGLAFVRSCQNWSAETSAVNSSLVDSRFDDGGFFFVHGDPTRNKPGEAGIDADGRVRYRSYGSTTADGLRALVACGLSLDHPRVRAARGWLLNHFSADSHPGEYPADREHLRQSLYYYFAASSAEALLVSRPNAARYETAWATELCEALLGRQRADGSWVNAAVDVREDDPLIATPLAISALFSCQSALAQVS